MTNVVNLCGHPHSHINEDLVGLLEELLERALRGDITSIAYAVIRNDGLTGTGYEISPDNHPSLVIGAVQFLSYRLCQEQEERTS